MQQPIIIASSNKGKIAEISSLDPSLHFMAYTECLPSMEIEEDADDFKGNAIIKANAVFEALNDDKAVVIADDSGLSIDALQGAPGVYSARYAGSNATDIENLQKAITALESLKLTRSPAHYTAAIAIKTQQQTLCVHGWMYGTFITEKRGNNGFGYDPAFIPEGFTQTLGELDSSVKKEISHRAKALWRMQLLLKGLMH